MFIGCYVVLTQQFQTLQWAWAVAWARHGHEDGGKEESLEYVDDEVAALYTIMTMSPPCIRSRRSSRLEHDDDEVAALYTITTKSPP